MRSWKILVLMLWLVLPLTALRSLLVWKSLPLQMATHFNAANQANGWMSREASLIFILSLMAVVLLPCTLALMRVRERKAEFLLLLGFFTLILGTLFYGQESVIRFNLYGTTVAAGPVLVTVAIGGLVLLATALLRKRGQQFAEGDVIAEEKHAVPAWGWLFVALLFVLLAVMVKAPDSSTRVAMGTSALILLVTAAGVFNGFHYYFTKTGLEIRTLGFRLRSIPAAHIQNYAVDKWNALGGYGIRGIGKRRAYVWGNKGVRIQTSDGEVFLGHDDPEKLIRDLDLILASRGGQA